jgi:hypothetical protein
MTRLHNLPPCYLSSFPPFVLQGAKIFLRSRQRRCAILPNTTSAKTWPACHRGSLRRPQPAPSPAFGRSLRRPDLAFCDPGENSIFFSSLDWSLPAPACRYRCGQKRLHLSVCAKTGTDSDKHRWSPRHTHAGVDAPQTTRHKRAIRVQTGTDGAPRHMKAQTHRNGHRPWPNPAKSTDACARLVHTGTDGHRATQMDTVGHRGQV